MSLFFIERIAMHSKFIVVSFSQALIHQFSCLYWPVPELSDEVDLVELPVDCVLALPLVATVS